VVDEGSQANRHTTTTAMQRLLTAHANDRCTAPAELVPGRADPLVDGGQADPQHGGGHGAAEGLSARQADGVSLAIFRGEEKAVAGPHERAP
jgi:hypothetical protein